MPSIEIRDVVVEYKTGGYAVRPLDGISGSIGDGQLALLLGPSGSGKTTLLSCLGAILRPTAGQIVLDGTDITGLDDKALLTYRRQSVGFVFQAFNLIPSLSALDNVAMLGQPRSATTRAVEPTTVSSFSMQEFRQRSRT